MRDPRILLNLLTGGILTKPVQEIEAIKRALRHRPEVRLVYAFGSAVAGPPKSSSDLDLAVLFEVLPAPRALDELTAALEKAAGRRVDLVLLAKAPLLKHEFVSRGKLLPCRDENERVKFETRAAASYLDTAYLRRVQHAYLRKRAEAYRGARP